MSNYINKIQTRFEDLKEKFSKEQIVLIFAQFEAEKLLEETELALTLLTNVSNADVLKHEYIVLNKQIKEFYELVQDIIEMRKENNL